MSLFGLGSRLIQGTPMATGPLTGIRFPVQPINPTMPMGGGAVSQGPILAQPAPTFVWGANGQKVNSGQRTAQPDFSPVDHWTQGAARVANALVDSMHERRDASRAQGFPDIPRSGFGFVNPFTAYTKGGGLY